MILNTQIRKSIEWLNQNYLSNSINSKLEIYMEENDDEVFVDISEKYEEETQLKKIDFLKVIDELRSSEIHEDFIKTKNRIIFNLGNNLKMYELNEKIFFNCKKNDISFSIIEPDLFIIISFFKILYGSKKYFDTIDIPLFMEIKLNTSTFSYKEFENILNSYLFELSNKLNLSFKIFDIHTHSNPNYDYIDTKIKIGKNFTHLKSFNPKMEEFINCISLSDGKHKYLEFFKILEHYGTILSQQDLHNDLHYKITNYNEYSTEKLQSIVNSINNIRNKRLDVIITSVLENTVILFSYKKYLPNSLKNIELKELAKKLCDYRNKVTHDKANFNDRKNLNCPLIEINLEKINLFMKNIAYYSVHLCIDQLTNPKLIF